MRLAGKRALVIGGVTGIGRAVTERIAEEGSKVAFTGRRVVDGPDAISSLESKTSAGFLELDVLDLGMLQATITQAAREMDGLDILVNCAGVALDLPIQDTSPEAFDLVFSTNTRFPFFAIKWAAEIMTGQSSGGSIVTIASTAGIRGLERRAAYCGSKGAVIQISKAAALDLADSGIRVNCVSPGAVDTILLRSTKFSGTPAGQIDQKIEALGKMQPLGRVGNPSDVASAVIYLASDESSWVTGSNLVVDGGLTAR